MLKIFLYPLSWLYGIVVYFRNQMYDFGLFKSKEFEVPVISVGNITVGGTGKTPQVEYLVNLLMEKFEVGTLSRGYKRKTKGFRWVETDSLVTEVGDEPLQIKMKFPDVKVSVCENRVDGVKILLQSGNDIIPDVVLLDDAFQHRRITAGLNILLIDYNRPIKDDTLLPAGQLREGKSQVRRANIIIFTKCPEEITPIMRRIMQKEIHLKPYQNLYFTSLAYGQFIPVFNGEKLKENFYSGKDFAILLVTGIASPSQIYKYLKKEVTDNVEMISFSDHHYYTESDIQAITKKFQLINVKNKLILTTEKDAIRFLDCLNLDEQFSNSIYYLPVKVKFLDQEGKLFNKNILGYVGENKSNRELYKRKNKR